MFNIVPAFLLLLLLFTYLVNSSNWSLDFVNLDADMVTQRLREYNKSKDLVTDAKLEDLKIGELE